MVKILVLFGGTSPERPISIRSADAVCNALRAGGHVVDRFDTAQPIDTLIPLLSRYDVIFPVLHGAGGEDGTIQTILEQHNIPFIGPGSQASARCFDKWQYKQALTQQHLPQPVGALVSQEVFLSHPLSSQPFVLKPNDGGSSVDTYIIREVTVKARTECLDAFTRHETMLLEELITGVEITVGILGNETLPVIEIIPPEGKEFDLENKYNGASQELCPPKHVTRAQQTAAQALALQAHTNTGCCHMSRTDMILNEAGSLFILETNTTPGLTDQSLFPKSALAAGLNMPALMDRLITLALPR